MTRADPAALLRRSWLRELLEAHADELADAVLERFRAGDAGSRVAGAGGPGGVGLDAATLRNLRLGARAAVDLFLARLSGADPAEPDLGLFVAHGRAQQAAGRTLTELLSFYRRGGLAMWERSTALLPAGAALPAGEIFAFGAAVLELVDELSVAAAGGFAQQEAEERRRTRALRERLLSLLLSDPPAEPDALAAAANAAGWTLPARVRVAVARLPAEPRPGGGVPPGAPAGGAAAGGAVDGAPAGGVPGEAPADERRPLSVAPPARVLGGALADGRQALVVGEDEEAERWLVRAASALGLEAPLAIGPAVPAREAARSAARAGALLDHVAAGALHDAGDVVRSDDHEIALLLGAAPDLAREVARRRLAPLDALDPDARRRMTETLAAWLADPGRPQAMADRLGLHVQTVRYRLRGLRALLGDALDDPDERFELALALRVHHP